MAFILQLRSENFIRSRQVPALKQRTFAFSLGLKIRKERMQEIVRYGWLGRLRSGDLKGQPVTTRRWDRLVADNVGRAIGRVGLTPGDGWCIGPNRAFPALVYHLHPRARACISAHYLPTCTPTSGWAAGVTAPERRHFTAIWPGADCRRNGCEKLDEA